jgi:hypothetical protein
MKKGLSALPRYFEIAEFTIAFAGEVKTRIERFIFRDA